uniref:ATP-dependent DNA helicase n=1 Tax=Caenorhabditis japonica TaxID=281687 RepID=A0A8R1IC08_CAEJA
MDTKQAAEERRSVAPNKNLANQERAGKDLEGIKDFRKLTYIEMPECFTFDKTRGEWKTRKRGGEWIIRRYALRLLLLYTKSATSFSDLKTTKDDNGIPTVHDTFVEAAKAQGLMSDDAVVIKSLEEMAAYHMPAQLRADFSAILARSEIGDTQTLWNIFTKDMSEDFLNWGHDQEESEARETTTLMKVVRLGKSIDTFTTEPTIVIDNSTDDFVDLDFHLGRRTQRDPSHALINEQERTVHRLDRNCQHIGDNYRIATHIFQNRNQCKGSNETKKLEEVDVIIWDECSMISKTALETADFVLRDFTDSPFPFGGKRIVLGGDFRQILPVIRRGTKTDLINNCIKNSYLWNQFKKFSLLDNMRIINGDANWIKFLLDVGDGVANDYEDRVTLLEGFPVLEDLVDDVFGGSNKGKDTFVPRITCYEDKNLPFHLKRTQFPVKLAFAISINKAQGQSFGRVGLYLPEDVFAH